MQADEARAGLELGERSVEVLIREDLPRLVALVRAPEQDDVRVAVDELDPLGEIVSHRLHRQSQDTLPREQPGRGERRRRELVVLQVDAQPAEVVGEPFPGPSWCCS